MQELSLNILDIAMNSVLAGSTLIEISIRISTKENLMVISINDNGEGMSSQLVSVVSDPFVTTRECKKTGLGIPFFKMAAEQAKGIFSIDSVQGVGTRTTASFVLDNIDRAPLGDIAQTLITLIYAASAINYVFTYELDNYCYEFDTRQVKQVMGVADLKEPPIIARLKEMIDENIVKINGGNII